VARALNLEDRPDLARPLADSVWERLHFWRRHGEEETREVGLFFARAAAHPPESYHDLKERALDLASFLDLYPALLEEMNDLDANMRRALDRWTKFMEAKQRDWEAATPPAKAPGKAPEPGSGSASAVS
jgi:hypothetical protein